VSKQPGRRTRPDAKACSAAAGSWLLHGFQLAIETGLRRGELLGIRWRDANLSAAILHVPFTKTDKARTIPLTDRAVEILAARKAASSTDPDVEVALAEHLNYRPPPIGVER
jgi:integrase